MTIARENGIKEGIGLRQGMPVSPMLSNLGSRLTTSSKR